MLELIPCPWTTLKSTDTISSDLIMLRKRTLMLAIHNMFFQYVFTISCRVLFICIEDISPVAIGILHRSASTHSRSSRTGEEISGLSNQYHCPSNHGSWPREPWVLMQLCLARWEKIAGCRDNAGN